MDYAQSESGPKSTDDDFCNKIGHKFLVSLFYNTIGDISITNHDLLASMEITNFCPSSVIFKLIKHIPFMFLDIQLL